MAFKDFAIATSFKAKDKFTRGFKAMGRGVKKFAATAVASFKRATSSASNFKSVTGGILTAGALTKGLGLLQRGLGAVTQQFIDFDQATIGAAARFKDIGPDAVDFQAQLGKIRDRAREAGAATEFTAAQAADSLDFLARAGFKSAEAFGVLDSMINLATASGEDFASVADMSSDLLGAFGLNVDDTSQKIANLNRLNDVLVKAANSANVTIEDMFETMKIAAPIATAMGQSLEDVTAITAFLGGAGIKGSKAATALKNSILNLVSPSTKASGMLRELGVDVDDGTGNMRKLNDIIGDLGPELKKMGEIKAGVILNEIFGKHAIAGAINIANGTEAIIKLKDALLDAGGTAQKTADLMRQSLGNRLKALGSAATELGFKVIEAFEVRGENSITKFTEAVRNFDPSNIIKFIEAAIIGFKFLWSIAGPILTGIKTFVEQIAIAIAMLVDAIASINISKKLGAVGNFLFGTIEEREQAQQQRQEERVPPNQEEAGARQQVDFQGNINLNGFPAGTTTDSQTKGAPDVNMEFLGEGA